MAYSIEIKNEVKTRLAEGEKVKQISEQMGISVPTIYNWKKEFEKEAKHKPTQDEIDTSKKIKKLVRLKQFDKAIKLTQKYPYNEVIQSQRMGILIRRKNYPEAKRIGERFIDNVPIQSQMVTIAIEEKRLSDKVQEKSKNKGDCFINKIKTKLYYNKIQEEDIDEIRQSQDISYDKKAIMLLAICEKTKSVKQAKKVMKEARENDVSNIAKLNMIMERIKSKKANIFDFGFYDDILHWKLDEDLSQKYQQEKRTQETERKAAVEPRKEELPPRKSITIKREQMSTEIETFPKINTSPKEKTISPISNKQKTQSEFRKQLQNVPVMPDERKRNNYIQDINRIINRLQEDKAPTYVKIEKAREAWNRIVEAEIKQRTELDKVRLDGKAKKKHILNIYAQDEQLKYLELSKREAYDEMEKVIERYDKIEELIEHLKESIIIINGKDTEKKQKSEEFLKRICEKFRKLEEKEERLNNGSR